MAEDGTSTAEIASTSPKPNIINCPVCAAINVAGNFCEACGYNFLTGEAIELSSDVAKWQVEVSINSQPKDADSPAPPNRPSQVLEIAVGSHLIGRTSQKRAILPEISLDFDDAISHRHALIELRADRSLILRDIGSANGTSLNGHEIPLTRDIPLQPGDIVTLGHWTKLTIIKK
jgi:FHA domain